MTRYEYLTAWMYGVASLSLICLFAFSLSMLSISLGDVAELPMKIKTILWRLGFGVVGAKLLVFTFWLYKKRERELWRY